MRKSKMSQPKESERSMVRCKSRHKRCQKDEKTKEKKRRRRKRQRTRTKQTKGGKNRSKMGILPALFGYFSTESNNPKFLSMDANESEFLSFPHEPAGVANYDRKRVEDLSHLRKNRTKC